MILFNSEVEKITYSIGNFFFLCALCVHSKLSYYLCGCGERNCGINWYNALIGFYIFLQCWKNIAKMFLAFRCSLSDVNHSVIFCNSWLTILTRQFRSESLYNMLVSST